MALVGVLTSLIACQPEENPPSQVEKPDVTITDNYSWESPFGIFGAYALEYQYFQKRLGLSDDAYWDWVDGHFKELGAHWTRSGLQLIWEFVEPEIGRGYRWQNLFHTDKVITRISASPAKVHWVGVFHEGGKSPHRDKPPLRNPAEHPADYARFVRAAVERYDGDGKNDLNAQVKIKHWQIGNEYLFWENSGRTISDYIAWAKLTSAAIKEADPEAKVTLIAPTQGFRMEPWLRTAIRELVPAGVIDVIDIHHWGTARDWRMTAVPEVRSLLNSLGRTNIEIFSCEHGTWAGNPAGQPVQTEEEQARSLVKRFVHNLNNGLDKLFWNNLMEWDTFSGQPGSIFNSIGLLSDGRNSGDPPERFNTTRIAYWSYWLLTHYLGNDIKQGKRIEAGKVDAFLFRFPSTQNAEVRFVGWSESGRTTAIIKEPDFKGISFTLVPDRHGNVGNKLSVSADSSGNIALLLDSDPVFIEGKR